MSSQNQGFPERIEKIIEEANLLRIESCDMGVERFADHPPDELGNKIAEGRDLIRKRFMPTAIGMDAVDSAEYHMRLSGMSSQRAFANASLLASLTVIAGDRRVPALMMGGGNRRTAPGVVLFGSRTVSAPQIEILNSDKYRSAELNIDTPSPLPYSRRQSFRAYDSNGEWRVGFNGGLTLSDLTVTEDPFEFAHCYDPRTPSSVILIGAKAVAEALPILEEHHGSAQTLQTIQRIVEKTEDPSVKITDMSVADYVEHLLIERGKTYDVNQLPVSTHGLLAEEFDPKALVAEILYQFTYPEKYKFIDGISEALMADQRRLRYDEFVKLAQVVSHYVATLLMNIGMRDPGGALEDVDDDRLAPIVASLIEHRAQKLPARRAITRRKLARGVELLKA